MILSIITINRNNAAGLEMTMRSVLSQTCKDFEYIIVDGASTDGSMAVIQRLAQEFGSRLKWLSEPDSGIYNAMNKGIRMAVGEYIEVLNSADLLAAPDVVERMTTALVEKGKPAILYGNMVKMDAQGKENGKSKEVEYSLRQYYASTMNHDCCFIKRSLFEEYGYYDETLKIVSDWKWFLQAIGLGKVRPVYVDIDVTWFDTGGISETNLQLRWQERRQVLKKVMPPAVLADYDKHATDMALMDRLRRHPWAYKLVWVLERCLFKAEKMKRKKTNVSKYE